MINGATIVELGLLAEAEAKAAGQVPSAEAQIIAASLAQARHEATLRMAASHGWHFTGTSVLEAMARGEVPRGSLLRGPVLA